MAAYVFLEVASMGAYGLVLANIVNMTVRTGWSVWFIQSFLLKNGDGIGANDLKIQPATYVLGVMASVARQRLSCLHKGLVPAITFSGAYILIM
ncbi:hypothetical protein N7532_003397 [Penicillium argentinense]|uniref:Man(5)GlcNAc(2)-PP-dolichol translocation protein RFT1 n=1 Tax=Penicillium argentinense TaxID=1131581 RepID=A0A9W9KEL9_9EURO|nr:uncharacterized protein N7532_003397 [Penicillium argentinense]KAJ5102868.1 hypothetical protein N7532_003397 [Penicillium argentinense]